MSAYSKINRFSHQGTARVTAIAAVLALPALTACGDQPVIRDAEARILNSDGSFFGEPVRIGDGEGRTYVIVEDGLPVEVGVALSERAMNDLPEGVQHGEGEHATMIAPYVLEMPAGNPTPYRFVGLDWNPNGHIPPGIYDTPHFDIHFYTISQRTRDMIVPSDPFYAQKAANFPDPTQIPHGYVDFATVGQTSPEAAAVPQMGMHWVDVASPELNGQAFTETLLYGTWDGEIIFVEPMITKEFLETRPDYTRRLPTSDRGGTPASYRIYWDEPSREYRVALREF